MNRLIIFSLALLFCGCDYKNNIQKSAGSKDTLIIESQAYFKQIITDQGPVEAERKEVLYFTGNELLLRAEVVSKPNESSGFYEHTTRLTAFKREHYGYKNLMWDRTFVNSAADEFFGEYFKLVTYGCCASYDDYRLIDLKTGDVVIEYSNIDLLKEGFVSFQSVRGMLFEWNNYDTAILGTIHYKRGGLIKDHLIHFYNHNAEDSEFAGPLKSLKVLDSLTLAQNWFVRKPNELSKASAFIRLAWSDSAWVILPVINGEISNELVTNYQPFFTDMNIKKLQ